MFSIFPFFYFVICLIFEKKICFDIFEKTHTYYHEDKVKEFILDLYDKGYIYENTKLS